MNLFFVGLVTLTTSAFGFTLSGSDSTLRGFDTDELQIAINTTNCPADLEERINNALDLWNSVPTSRLKMVLTGSTTVTSSTIIGLNYGFGETAIITCSVNMDTDTGSVGARNSVAGVGFAGAPSGSPSNRITKAGMILNFDPTGSQRLSLYPTSSVEAVIAHELGHMIGLGHSDNTKALMYYSSSRTHLALDQDDIDGISFLYPRNEFGQDGFFGCGLTESVIAAAAAGKKLGGGNDNNFPPTGIAIVLLLPLLVTQLLARLKRPLLSIRRL